MCFPYVIVFLYPSCYVLATPTSCIMHDVRMWYLLVLFMLLCYCPLRPPLLSNLILPVATATAVRTFSTLRHMKNYLSSTMTQQRLDRCMLLHISSTMAQQRLDRCMLLHISSTMTQQRLDRCMLLHISSTMAQQRLNRCMLLHISSTMT